MMWLSATWVFMLCHHALKGHMVVKSLKAFYIYNILDDLIAFTVVALANGLLYPVFFKKK